MSNTISTSVKLGIIGAGRLGGFHADKAAAHPDVILSGVYDPYRPHADRVASKHAIPAFASLDLLLDEVDAVVIAATSSHHAELGLAALSHGKHLLLEKPLATKGEDAHRLVSLANEKKVVFQVGHSEQYNPAWLAALDALGGVRQGNPCFIRAERESGYTFRCVDIGAVLDLMIHDLELILSLVPSSVVEVRATGYSFLGGLEDCAFAHLHFENGTNATLTASRMEAQPKRKMTIYSSDAKLDIDFQTRTTTSWSPDDAVIRGEFSPQNISPERVSELAPLFMQEHFRAEVLTAPPIDALSLEMDNFVSAILRGTPSRVPALRAAQAVELAEKITNAIIHHATSNICAE